MKIRIEENRRFFRGMVTVAASILFLLSMLLFFEVFHAFLLIFAAVLFAVCLDAPVRWLANRFALPRLLSLGLVIAALLALTTVFFVLAGGPISQQISMLGERLPQAIDNLKSQLAENSWGKAVLTAVPEPEQIVPSFSDMLSRISVVFTTTVGAFANMVIVLLIGFYVALNPRLYTNGLMHLLPARCRERGWEVIASIVHALRWWLLGRLVAMTAVGLLTGLGLWAIGMPLALALGFIAGLLSFVPYVGPIVSAVPAILVALADGGLLETGYVVLIYGAAQILEGNLITPVVQKYSVSLPPAVLIIAQFMLAIPFGPVGVLLATPFAVPPL